MTSSSYVPNWWSRPQNLFGLVVPRGPQIAENPSAVTDPAVQPPAAASNGAAVGREPTDGTVSLNAANVADSATHAPSGATQPHVLSATPPAPATVSGASIAAAGVTPPGVSTNEVAANDPMSSAAAAVAGAPKRNGTSTPPEAHGGTAADPGAT